METKDFSNVTHFTQVDVQPGGINIQHVENLYQADFLKALGIEVGVKKQVTNSANNSFSLLDTPKAQQLWTKAIDAGWVDTDRQPTNRLDTKAAKAVFANVMIEKLNVPRPGYVPFEALWGVAGLQNSYSSGIERNVNGDLKKQIKESLR
ncbi:hypothetical protein [Prevotella sp.]|uniref:hypothetical protein n=1 Tax=uncultured Prevotella sp. TaxID=159272 RepID=UPI0025E1F158|nr:hypothetical protein [uncultured Prevotella sp.]